MRPAVFALSAALGALCLAAALAAPLDDVDSLATKAEKTPAEAAVDPAHPDEISFLRSRFKEEAGVDVQDEDLHHLLQGAARFAMSADALEGEVPPYPVDSIKAQADVDDEPTEYRSA